MRGELSLTSQCTISCKPCTAACSPYRPKAQAQTKSQTLTWSPTMSPYPCSPIQARASTMGEGGEACSTHIAPKANGEAQQHLQPTLGCKKKSLYVKKKNSAAFAWAPMPAAASAGCKSRLWSQATRLGPAAPRPALGCKKKSLYVKTARRSFGHLCLQRWL